MMEEKYNNRLGKAYQTIIRKIASLYGITSNEAEVFYLSQKPALRKQLEAMVQSHFETISANIKAAALEAWAFSSMMYDKEAGKRPTLHLQGKQAQDATKAFNEAKARYLADLDKRLSKSVWKWEKQFMDEIELTMQVGFKEGASAAKLSRDVRQYLNNPEKLFRRVRDEFGQLHLSKAAAAYHPGQGVYRSSYKNALRMTGTEINRAYRLGEHHRRLADPEVVGIEIKLSNNHTLNGKPFTDICDHLAGQYPKDFVFTGWHPKCRCKSISILVSDEEFDKITDDILDGGDGRIKSVNEVKDVPQGYKDWCDKNAFRSRGWKDNPYFIKDNPEYNPQFFNAPKFTDAEKVFFRHPSTHKAIERMDTPEYRKKYPKHTSLELGAIHHYTRSNTMAYRDLNKSLVTGKMDDFNSAFSDLISNGLNKLPDFEGVVYRGSILNNAQLSAYLDAHTRGAGYTHKFFTSGSKDIGIAKGFTDLRRLKKSEQQCIFEISSKKGKYVNDISEFNSKFAKTVQQEVIFDKGTKFDITEIAQIKGTWYIKMSEL